jgi:hypothetical protein
MLANALGMDLYGIDLAAVVNKYIGETRKTASRPLPGRKRWTQCCCLDEGDALLRRRTDVHTANDRHANLETACRSASTRVHAPNGYGRGVCAIRGGRAPHHLESPLAE